MIYIDGSHLEAMGKDPWREDGIGHFMRVLAEADYLPIDCARYVKARLAGAKMVDFHRAGAAVPAGARLRT